MEVKAEAKGSIIIISLDGEFSLGNVKDVERVWNDKVATGPSVIAFDCKKLSFIDSSAIGTLVKFLNASSKGGFKMLFFDPSESLGRIFHTAKLNRIFTVMSREEFEQTVLNSQ